MYRPAPWPEGLAGRFLHGRKICRGICPRPPIALAKARIREMGADLQFGGSGADSAWRWPYFFLGSTITLVEHPIGTALLSETTTPTMFVPAGKEALNFTDLDLGG